MKKLTKKQVEFFDNFARNMLVNTLLIKLDSEGRLPPQEVQDQIAAIIATADVSVLSKAVGEKLLEEVDFAVLVKVEKFLNSPEAKKAMVAAQKVGAAVEEEIYDVLNEIFTEKAE